MAKLYILATPIGNLEDITLRTLRMLKEADFIVCEDTRHTLQLLNHFQIKKPLISYHQHSRLQKVEEIIGLLKQDKNLALVSDAGTPGISDPGNVLVKKVIDELGENVQVIPVPGACALTTLASVAGLPTDKFLFLGFLPHKSGRQKLFEIIKNSEQTVIFYESPYRILKTMESLAAVLEPTRQLVIGRELTKMFETIYRGTATQVLEKVKAGQVKGEFVVLVEGRR